MVNKVTCITYTNNQIKKIESGLNSIKEVLEGEDVGEKRSLLLCLDRYFDSYYGHKLDYLNDIVDMLQVRLFIEKDREVKEDILELLACGKGSLDYLAERIDNIEKELLADGLYALASVYDKKYIPIFKRYKDDNDNNIKSSAREAIEELGCI